MPRCTGPRMPAATWWSSSMLDETAQLSERIANLEIELAERRRAEELQRALYEIAALSAADSPQHEHYVELHEIVGRLMYAKNFIIASLDRKSTRLNSSHSQT